MRRATVARLLLGGICLATPHRVLALAGGPDRDDVLTSELVRALGARLLLQVVGDAALGRRMRRLDIVLELTHAASMLPVAVRWPRHRRTALTGAVAAVSIAALDLSDA